MVEKNCESGIKALTLRDKKGNKAEMRSVALCES